MSIEIERKFLIDTNKLNLTGNGKHIIQGYLTDNKKNSIRVRHINRQAFITIKGAVCTMIRPEFEYSISVLDADYMFKHLCLNNIVKKTRYTIHYDHHDWLIDKFEGANEGLIIAEIELTSKKEYFKRPDWLLKEVTNNAKYYNSYLAKYPFSTWIS